MTTDDRPGPDAALGAPRGPGWFVTIEGGDGSGKTLQAERLAALAEAQGVAVRLVREPGGTWAGERIREILLGAASTNERISPRADALLFSASRAQLVDEVVRPGVARGELVIDARHADSTLAYQGFGRGLDVDELRAIQRFATAGLTPDLTILLDLPVEIGLARKSAGERNRFEAGFEVDFHRRVREGYLRLATQEPERFAVIDASADPDVVFSGIVAALGRLPGLAARLSGPPSG
ncbi:MAG TPA: dTMP kinase [Candidatus Limnocylindrales bacterium]|nr:dTMP kinase [Candidatus Limnocylindrales bacterium]